MAVRALQGDGERESFSVAVTLLPLSAAAWTAAFLGFGLVYGPTLARSRRRDDTVPAR
jgi:uncharacterized protein involved in response to NO